MVTCSALSTLGPLVLLSDLPYFDLLVAGWFSIILKRCTNSLSEEEASNGIQENVNTEKREVCRRKGS
jgi:hypothetical protein